MLDVIGAGVTATSTTDWHKKWNDSAEGRELQNEIDRIVEEGKKYSVTVMKPRLELSTSWMHQMRTLWRRDLQRHWRDPIYLMNKLMLNLIGGLFMGFTFFKAKDSLQATQNKVFVRYLIFTG